MPVSLTLAPLCPIILNARESRRSGGVRVEELDFSKKMPSLRRFGLRTLSIVAVCVINVLIGLRYVWLIRRDKISPALAMWVFFTIAVIGSLLTYLSEGDSDCWTMR